MPAGLVRDQVVEVKVPDPRGGGPLSYGSGYLLAPSLVLTAAHVVKGFQSADVVFSARQPDAAPRFAADVAWTGQNCDVALLRVRWPGGGPPWPVTPAQLGDVPRVSSVIPFEGYGFPKTKDQDLAAGGHLRDGDRVPGDILAERNVKTGKLDLRLTADPAGAYGAWKGFSGTAVFAHGFLVGVVTEARAGTPRLTAGRIAVAAGACWALNPSFTEPDESVRNFRALLAQDGHDLRVSPARRRPAYASTVEGLRPRGGLAGRAAELAELRAFVRPGGAAAERCYADWAADAWAGKTALAAQFASDPPPGADVVAFFVSRAEVAQADAFWKQTCDQLDALLNEPIPSPASEVTFTRLWERAGEQAERSGRTIVLLVDGLDENHQRPPIARAIPADGDSTRKVIVFRREQPPLALRRGHPLADPSRCVRRTLARSRRAGELREDALTLLEDFLEGERAGVLGVLAAAGPISARDIAHLRRTEDAALTLDADLIAAERVSPVLRDAERQGLIWPLAGDPERFAFQHATLLELAAGRLDGAVRAHRNAIKRWAADYAARGWPPDTPPYLLVGYPALLTDLADAPGLAALAGPARAARLRAATGDDAATADELAAAVRLVAVGGPDAQPDLAAACGLAFRREQLLDALARYPLALIEAHAVLGHWQRAERIAAHQAWAAAQASGLTTVAAAAANAGQGRRSDQLFIAALHALNAIGDRELRYGQRKTLATAAAASARLLPAQTVRDAYTDTSECASALLDFAVSYSLAGLTDYAEQFIDETCGPGGPLAAAVTAADQARVPAPSSGNNLYGEPGGTLTDVARRQAAIQNILNITDIVVTVAGVLVRDAARAGRLDTSVRVAAILPQRPDLLTLIGEACRTVTDELPASQLATVLAEARAAADGLPGPVQRAAALTILAAAASGQLAADTALAARIATAAVADPAQQELVANVVAAAATAGQPVPALIAGARAALAGVAEPAQRAAALANLTLSAAAAGQPVDDLIAAAQAAALAIGEHTARALTMGTVAQAAAVTAWLSAAQSMAGGTADPGVLRWLAGQRQAVPGDLSVIWMTLSNQWADDATRAARLRDQVTAMASIHLAGARSAAASLVETGQAPSPHAAQAGAPLAAALSGDARRIAAAIADPVARSATLGALAHGFAACGLLTVARSIADELSDAGQRAWAYAAIFQATAAAGQPAGELLTAARALALTVEDPGRQAWLLSVLAQAAGVAGDAEAGRAVAAAMKDPGQQAWAFGLSARAAAAAGQPTGDLITAARDAARLIRHPAQRAWALAQAASDAARCAHPDAAAGLLAEAEQAALAEDPVLRAALLAALAQASGAQPERAAVLFSQACREADVPDPVQRAMALAEIARFAPGRPGWPERIAGQVQQAAALTDPVQRSAVLPFLLRAASRSGEDDLALTIAGSITSPADKIAAVLLLARSSAVRGDYRDAEERWQAAAYLRGQSGHDAPPWAGAAIENTRAFCEGLQAAQEAAQARTSAGFGAVRALFATETTAVIPTECADALAMADAAAGNDELALSKIYAGSVPDPTRRGYLLAAIAEAELAAGKATDAAATVALLPPRAVLADRSARGRLLAVCAAVALAAGGAEAARAELADGLADCFSPELVPALAALDPQAVERLAAEIAGAAGT